MRCGRRAALWAVLVGSCVAVLPVTGAAAAGEGPRPRTERISVTAEGSQANDYSDVGGISANGRYVAFDSSATNLVAGDTNGFSDIFVKDLGLVEAMARVAALPVPLAAQALQLFVAQRALGHGGRDDAFVLRVWQRIAGFALPGEPDGAPANEP